VKLLANVCIDGPAEIGDDSTLYPGVCVGFPPQDVKFKPGMATAGVKVGARCLLREHVTIHAASKPEGAGHPTTVGDDCFLMVNTHLGHDVRLGSGVILVNGVLLAGHSEVMDKATLSGNAALHQFARVGRYAFVTGLSGHSLDVPPFCIASARNTVTGINAVGLRRNGFAREDITRLREAFRLAFRVRLTRPEQVGVLRELGRACAPVAELAEFVASSKRGVSRASTHVEDGDGTDEA
jgi:UDP-N-acetylglucosamine acyltransferase